MHRLVEEGARHEQQHGAGSGLAYIGARIRTAETI